MSKLTTVDTLVDIFSEVCRPAGRSPLKKALLKQGEEYWQELAQKMLRQAEREIEARPRLENVHYVAWAPLYGSLGKGCLAISIGRNGVSLRNLQGEYGAVWGLPRIKKEV